jgi:hypothetical protein
VFWLIENKGQFETFKNRNVKEAFVEIIPYSPFIHPVENSICCIYIRPLQDYKGYLFPIYHTEVEEKLFEDKVFLLIKNLEKIYCRDKKEFLHYFPLKQLIDITLTSPTYIQFTPAHEFLYHKYPNKQDINTIVPIVKHYEYCEALFEELEHLIDKPVNKFYNDKVSWVFNGIERAGLFVDNTLYNDYFDKDIDGCVVYTQYNIKTLTTRPSNNFNGINYAALNKENGCRKVFITRNSKLVEFDITAYHPTLLSRLVGYDFGDKDIYSHFAEVYGLDRQEAKILTLQQLYGGILSQYKDLEFFRKVQAYVDDLWDTFQHQGFIKCPISGYEYYKDKLENMNPQKLLNYVLQNLETSFNVRILWDIFKILKGKKTKIVLYTYDSFLFDWDKEEKQVLQDINQIFTKHKLIIKVTHGTSYDFEPTI